jgi:dienelactone hydrolase
VVAFHGTGGNPTDFLDEAGLRHFADATGVVIAAPQALERNGGQGEPGDPDHYAGGEGFYGTSWNMTTGDATTNNDLLLVRAIIQAARNAWGVDSDHVYALGHSNGAFFSYHAAMSLPDRFAGFAENAGGAVRCAHRESNGPQFVGTGTSCAALATQSGYPTCDGPLKPLAPPSGRVPWGFLAHHNDDDVVSVAWTCTLASALGARAQTLIKAPDGNSAGHSVVEGFADRAWAFLSRHSRTD